MPKAVDTGQPEQMAQLYTELLRLFEEARQLQAHSTHLLAVARQASGDVPTVETQPESCASTDAPLSPEEVYTRPESHASTDAPLSSEETLDSIMILLAACSFERQVHIVKSLALAMASIARARANVKHPPAA
jgi:hypothetical protein